VSIFSRKPQLGKDLINIISLLRDLMMVGILITSIVPKTSNKAIFVPLVFLWLIFSYISNSKCMMDTFVKPSIKTYSVYLWLLFYLLFYIVGYAKGIDVYLINFVRIGFSILIINYYIELKDSSTLKKFGLISIIICCFVCITTCKELIINPNAARLLATGDQDLTENITGIVGSYGFIYGLVFLCAIIIGCFVSNLIIKHKLVWILILVLFLFTIYKASFMIALILIIAITILLIFKIDKFWQFLIMFLGVFIVIKLCIPEISYCLTYISSIVKSNDLSMRFYEINQLLSNGNSYGTVDLASRIERYNVSIHSFMSSPFIGIGGYYEFNTFGVGGHSMIFDELARYGILGTSQILIAFIFNMKYIYKRLDKISKKIYLKCCIVFFILGLINTILFVPLIIMMFFIVPALLIYFKEDGCVR
jgi:hypothetical protein